jgi:2',3'-cyclic-nucleotide 2'-phosphodiesterase
MSFHILAVGDVMGRPGREALEFGLKKLRAERAIDFVIVNGENAAGGFGITKKIFLEFLEKLEIDCVTMGNHWMDKKDVHELIHHERLVLPGNMSNVDDVKQGWRIVRSRGGTPVAVMNIIGKIFMKGENKSPFDGAERALSFIPQHVKVRVLDIHAEATSEKQGVAQLLAGNVSVIYGTHSHVPSADERILSHYTGFVTDLGMTGPYDSVIGIEKVAAIRRMRTGERKNFEPAKDNPMFFGCLFTIDEQTGCCTAVERLRFPANRG